MKKIGVIIAALMIMGVVFVSGCVSEDTNTTSTSTDQTPTPVTITQLYGNSIKEGTLVKVSGEVFQSSSSNLMLSAPNGKDLMAYGNDMGAFEGDTVTVVGTYAGPQSYETVMGAARTVPTLNDAKIV